MAKKNFSYSCNFDLPERSLSSLITKSSAHDMKKLIILIGFIFAAALSTTAQISGGTLSPALPEIMPSVSEMQFAAGGGMVRRHTHITVSGNTLLIEQLNPGDRAPKEWSAKISNEDKKTLYRAFAENKFDFSGVAAKARTVYDAPTQSVSISVPGTAYHVANGAGSPLEGANLESYEKIIDAFKRLQAVYKNKMVRTK